MCSQTGIHLFPVKPIHVLAERRTPESSEKVQHPVSKECNLLKIYQRSIGLRIEINTEPVVGSEN
jgi:hypothetical protein